jgi:alpha-beta hydrolase superfamily lysophospholipase
MLKAASPAIAHPTKARGIVTLSAEQFHFGFTNTWPEDEAKAAYERYAVPETGRIFFQDGLANFAWHSPAQVDWKKADRAPLLITAGEHDHTVAASVSKANYEKYDKSAAVVDFVEFPGRSHLLMAGPGWEEVATKVAEWIEKVIAPPPLAAA